MPAVGKSIAYEMGANTYNASSSAVMNDSTGLAMFQQVLGDDQSARYSLSLSYR